MNNSSQLDATDMLDRLNEQQQQQLTELLDDYLQRLERGECADPSELTVDHPDLRDAFGCYVAKLNAIHGLAGVVQPLERIDLDSLEQDEACRLGEFEIIQEIGRGGMGTVYEARQASLNRRVALKLLPMSATFDARQVARFKNEANAAGQLHHPNIVPIYSVGSARHIHYYSMQLIDGVSIDQWVNQHSAGESMPWQQPVRWAIEIASALQCAHESGIIHRDIKPSNLMLDQNDRIWVTDFGLARCQTDLALTQSGDMIGTLRYMSPEQAAGKPEVVDYRTDIYSLAASLFEMLTLRPAIQGADRSTLLRQLDRDEPVRLKDVRPDLPTELSVVLQKAMAKRKDDRYESADQFSDDLQCVLGGRPTLAQPPSLAIKIQRFSTRHRRSMAAAASMIAVLLIVLAISSVVILRKNQDILGHKLRADRNFQRARSTVDQFGSTVAQRLAAIPGTERVRRSLLEDTLDYYKQFIAEANNAPELLTEIATTHTKIGYLVTELESAAKAIDHFRTAAECFEKLPGRRTGDDDVRRLIAANDNHLGLALASTGQVSESMAAYQRAIALQNQIATSLRSDSDSVQLATIQNNLGLLYRQIGRNQDARNQFVQSIGLLTGLGHYETQPPILAAVLSNLSSLTMDSEPSESARLLETAIAQRLASIKQSPNRLLASSEIGMMYSNLGSAQMRLKDLDAAASAFESAIRLQRQLHGIAPTQPTYRRNLAMSLNNLGLVRQKQANAKEAASTLAEAVDLQRKLAEDSFTAKDRTRLGAMEHNYAVTQTALRNDDQAAELFRRAIERQKSVLADSPDAKRPSAYLLQHYFALLKSQVRRGRWSDMRETEAALRETARGDRNALENINSRIRSTRSKQDSNETDSVAMVTP